MTFASFITFLFSSFLKPFLALILSFFLSVSSLYTGAMGEYYKLQIAPLGFDPIHTEVNYEAAVNMAAIAAIAGIDLKADSSYSELSKALDSEGFLRSPGSFDIYADLTNAKLALTFGKDEDNYGMYLDANAFAVTPELTGLIFGGVSEASPLSAILPPKTSEFASAYSKHTKDYGFYYNFGDELSEEMENLADSSEMQELEVSMSFILDVYREVFSALASEDCLKVLGNITKKANELSSKYYTETELNGQKAYNFRMTGKEYLNLQVENLKLLSDKEFLESYTALMEALIDGIDYTKIAEKAADVIGLSAEEKAEALKQTEEMKLTAKESLAQMTAEMEASLTEISTVVSEYLTAITTGEGIEELFGAEAGAYITLLLPFINNSYVSSTLANKDGAILESYELCITNGTLTMFTFKYDSETEVYEESIPTPDSVVPFGVRLTPEVLSNKVGFERAAELGVNKIEICWDADMKPTDTEVKITLPDFIVTYDAENDQYAQYLAAKNDPNASEEEKNSIPEWPENLDKNVMSDYIDTSAVVVEGSVYLPLRQLMENAGYEVSWDADARKAYVTVSGEKIEMTGLIVNNKTYVKVRDFEKLGAKIDYVEDIYEAADWNDFSKTCYATIEFKK